MSANPDPLNELCEQTYGVLMHLVERMEMLRVMVSIFASAGNLPRAVKPLIKELQIRLGEDAKKSADFLRSYQEMKLRLEGKSREDIVAEFAEQDRLSQELHGAIEEKGLIAGAQWFIEKIAAERSRSASSEGMV